MSNSTDRYSWDPADNPVLDLTAGTVSAVALCGTILPTSTDADTFQVATGTGQPVDYPIEFRPVVEYLHNLRDEDQARRYLADLGAPDGTLDQMIDNGKIVRITAADEGRELDITGKARVEPTSAIWSGSVPGEMMYATPSRAPGEEILDIGDLMAEVIYRSDTAAPLMEVLNQVSTRHGMAPNYARRCLALVLPGMLAGDYLYFCQAKVRAPRRLFSTGLSGLFRRSE